MSGRPSSPHSEEFSATEKPGLQRTSRNYLDLRAPSLDGLWTNSAVQWLIDGMGFDQVWAGEYLSPSKTKIQEFVNSQIYSKCSHIDYRSDNKITTCIVTEEASCVWYISGPGTGTYNTQDHVIAFS